MSYAKLVRGPMESYQALQVKDDNTLYFVYESSQSPTGQLYLGNKLIGGGDLGSATVGDLGDIDINVEELADGMVLVYNTETGKWEATNLDALAFKGAVSPDSTDSSTQGLYGSAGLVPAPDPGDENKFLSGSGKWASVEPFVASAAQAAVAEAIGDVPETFDTLKDIIDWLKDDEGGVTSLINRVSALENVDNNTDERIDMLEDSSVDYGTRINTLETTKTNHTERIVELEQRLEWDEF